ncbi:MAG: hypothetical protein FWD99_00245 [Oscillospiraceae bacterium]|nr:hypothetical protein [Oscillospiraceae bacterium]
MKRTIAILTIVALLLGTLVGCVTPLSDVDDFLALWEEFLEQREYSFTGEMTMQMEDPEAIELGMEAVNTGLTGTVSLDHLEMQMTITLSLMEGTPDMTVNTIATEDGLFFDMGGMLQFMFDLIFAELGMGLISIDIAQLLDGNRYVVLPVSAEQDAADALFTPVFIGKSLTYEELEAHLTRADDVFILILEGEILERAMDDVAEMMDQFNFDFGELAEEMGMDGTEFDWGESIGEVDYSDARLVTRLSRDGDSFRQVVEWDIPGEFTSRMDVVYTVREVEPLDLPEAMTLPEFVDFMENLDFDEMLPDFGGGFGAEHEPIYDIVYTLTELNLTDHTLPADSLLQTVALPDGFGGETAVTVTAGVDFFPGDWSVDSGTERLWFRYISWYDMDAMEAVKWMAGNDWELFFSQMTFSDLRTNRDYSIAIMASEILANGLERYLCIYMAQVIPETGEVILLDLTLVVDFMREEDYEIVAELGEHVGVDLLAFISKLLGETL